MPRVSKAMRQAARLLRREETKSEDILWAALRDRKLGGRKFRRQHPFGAFVVDFYCHQERLAIEIDGGVHEALRSRDKDRQEAIASLNIRFLRLPASLVERDLSAALRLIKEALTPGPSPALRERGVRARGRGEGH